MLTQREKYLESMPKHKGFQRIYRLRWMFIFTDGKVRFGVWNGATNRFSDSAASINKTGLLTAQIQAEDVFGHGVKTIYECDGHDYVTAKWNAATSAPAFLRDDIKNAKLSPEVVGLTFLTRDYRVSVFVNGDIIQRNHRNDEKIEKIREHSI